MPKAGPNQPSVPATPPTRAHGAGAEAGGGASPRKSWTQDHARVLEYVLRMAAPGAPPAKAARALGLPLPQFYRLASELLGEGAVARPKGDRFYLTPSTETLLGQIRQDLAG